MDANRKADQNVKIVALGLTFSAEIKVALLRCGSNTATISIGDDEPVILSPGDSIAVTFNGSARHKP